MALQEVPVAQQKEKCGWFALVCNGWQRSMESIHENQGTLGHIAIDLIEIDAGLSLITEGPSLMAGGGVFEFGSFGTATVIAVPAAALGVTATATGGGLLALGGSNLRKDLDDLHWNNQAQGSSGADKTKPDSYMHDDETGNIYATLDKKGDFDYAIEVAPGGKGKGWGRKLFHDAMDKIGPQNVKTFRGNWSGQGTMRDNFDSYKNNIGAGMGPEDAAKNTFTGKMARDYGFNNVRVVVDSDAKVVAEFTR